MVSSLGLPAGRLEQAQGEQVADGDAPLRQVSRLAALEDEQERAGALLRGRRCWPLVLVLAPADLQVIALQLIDAVERFLLVRPVEERDLDARRLGIDLATRVVLLLGALRLPRPLDARDGQPVAG